MNDSGEPSAIRFPDALRKKIRKFCEDFQIKTGLKINFSEAVRVLAERGLTVEPEPAKQTRR